MKSTSYRLAKRYLEEYNEHKAEIIPTNKYEPKILKISNNNDRLKSALQFYREYKAQGGKRIIKELEGGN